MFKLKPVGTFAHGDRIGKVFLVINQDLRQCLICDGVFPREAAAEHAGTVCFPSPKTCPVPGLGSSMRPELCFQRFSQVFH